MGSGVERAVFAAVVLLAGAAAAAEGARRGPGAAGRAAAADGVMEARRGGPSGAGAPRPDHDDVPAFARWLVHENLWGVIGTTSNSTGLPFTNVVDLSDGPVCASTGRLLFYLTQLDETARDAAARPKVSFSVVEAALGCKAGGSTDAEVRFP